MSNGSQQAPGSTSRDPWEAYTPPRIVTTGPKPAEVRMPLFYVDDVEYTAPRFISAPTAIRALRTIALRGPDAGIWEMVEECLSSEALEILTTCEHVSYEDAQHMLQQLGRLYYGQAQALGKG